MKDVARAVGVVASAVATVLLYGYAGWEEPFIVPQRGQMVALIVLPAVMAFFNLQCAVMWTLRVVRTRKGWYLILIGVSAIIAALCVLLMWVYMADIAGNTRELLDSARR